MSMTCPSSDTLSDLAFTAIYGSATIADAGKLRDHLKTCDVCANVYAQWQAIADMGRAARSDTSVVEPCPEDNAFAEYIDGVLFPSQRSSFERHCATCTACARQLSELHTLLNEATRTVPRHQIALEWIQEGLSAIGDVAGAFHPVPVKYAPVLKDNNAPTALSWEANCDGHAIQITLQRISPEQMTLHVALRFSDSAVSGRRVTVRNGGEILESRVTDREGAIVFYGLPASDFDTEIDLPCGPFAFSIGSAGRE